MTMPSTKIKIPSSRYQDEDDCLGAAVADYLADRPALAGYDLEPRWEDEDRETIVLTVPSWAVEDDSTENEPTAR